MRTLLRAIFPLLVVTLFAGGLGTLPQAGAQVAAPPPVTHTVTVNVAGANVSDTVDAFAGFTYKPFAFPFDWFSFDVPLPWDLMSPDPEHPNVSPMTQCQAATTPCVITGLADGTSMNFGAIRGDAAGLPFSGFSGDCTGTVPFCTVKVIKDVTVTATFGLDTVDPHTLSVSVHGEGHVASPNGIDCPGAHCSNQISENSEQLFADSTGGVFTGWGGSCAGFGSNPICTVPLSSTATSVSANFQSYRVVTAVVAGGGTVTTSAGGGMVCAPGATCRTTVIEGTPVVLTATPLAGARAAAWSGCDSVQGNECTVTPTDEDLQVTATFGQLTVATLSVAVSGPGSVASVDGNITCIASGGSTCANTYGFGTAVTLNAAPQSGYTTNWSGACAGAAGASCSVTMDADKTVGAAFVQATPPVPPVPPGPSPSHSPPVRSMRRLRTPMPYVARCGSSLGASTVTFFACLTGRPIVFKYGPSNQASIMDQAAAAAAVPASVQAAATPQPAAPEAVQAAQPQDTGSPCTFEPPWPIPGPPPYPIVYTLQPQVPTALAPFRMMVAGDSLMWGDGNCREQKYHYQTAQALATKLGRPVEVDDYSHSGAVMDDQLPPDKHNVSLYGELPVSDPDILNDQFGLAQKSGLSYDFVLADGCLNDLSAANLVIPIEHQPVETWTRLLCKGEVQTAMQRFHYQLKGSPKVLWTGYFPIFSRRSVTPFNMLDAGSNAFWKYNCTTFPGETNCPGSSDLTIPVGDTMVDWITRIDPTHEWAGYTTSGFTDYGALFTGQGKLWHGIEDPVIIPRMTNYIYTLVTLKFPDVGSIVKSPVASMAHPDVEGNQLYTGQILTSVYFHDWYGF